MPNRLLLTTALVLGASQLSGSAEHTPIPTASEAIEDEQRRIEELIDESESLPYPYGELGANGLRLVELESFGSSAESTRAFVTIDGACVLRATVLYDEETGSGSVDIGEAALTDGDAFEPAELAQNPDEQPSLRGTETEVFEITDTFEGESDLSGILGAATLNACELIYDEAGISPPALEPPATIAG